MQPSEILIIGAGPVGLAVAALLAAGPAADRLRIRIVDSAAKLQWDASETDLRVYALSRAAQDALVAAGAWPEIASLRISAYARMRVWEGATRATAAQLCFDSADIGEPTLGHIVEDGLIRHALIRALERRSDVELTFARQVASIDIGARSARVSFEDRSAAVSANLLIGADGARSRVRAAARLSSVERDYAQHAIVAHVVPQQAHDKTAWQRFLPGGPLALLPLADGRCSIVWSLPLTEARRWLDAEPDEFEQRLTYASGGVLGALRLDSERAALPLIARHTHDYCRSRLVLAGDAAHSVHPLAGQGVNLGFADAAELAKQISAAVLEGQDPGDLRVLKRYERARKGPNILMLGALDGLDRLFRSPPLLAPVRTVGLRIVNRMPLLKNELIRLASGIESTSQHAQRGHGSHASIEDKF